ncbi:DedA family protein [Actinoplanes sp. NPDC051513]|uniref:DedA family protein n=1 Tax=Actinoplanes sp. NPDC051513 TaxID=3363908 RepID=UPI0037A7580B
MIADLVSAATAFVGQLSTYDEWTVLVVTFLSTGIEMTFLLGLLVPGESVVMLAGSLPHGPAGIAAAVVVGTAGGLTGQICGYAVGRAFGPRLRGTRLGRRIGAERFDRAEAYLRERGAPALVAVRFVAVIHAVVPIVAGIVRMPFGRFLGWSALGTALWVGAFAGLGALTAGADSTGGVTVVLTAIGATCLGVVPLGARLIRRAFTAAQPPPAGACPGGRSPHAPVSGSTVPLAAGPRRTMIPPSTARPAPAAPKNAASPTLPAARPRFTYARTAFDVSSAPSGPGDRRLRARVTTMTGRTG